MKTDVIVKTVVVNKDGRVLLLRRSKTDPRRPLTWDLPGGHVDEGEAFEDTAKRELREEAGLVVQEVTVLFTETEIAQWADDAGEHTSNVIRLFYRASVAHDSTIKLSFEHDASQWVSVDDAIAALEKPVHKSAALHYKKVSAQ